MPKATDNAHETMGFFYAYTSLVYIGKMMDEKHDIGGCLSHSFFIALRRINDEVFDETGKRSRSCVSVGRAVLD